MEKQSLLSLNKLSVSILDKPILYDIDLDISAGTIHAIMGPNGSGKSSLASSLMGNPTYTINSGTAYLFGKDLLAMPIHERARNGLFLAFQHPYEIPGVSVISFLREAYTAIKNSSLSVPDFHTLLKQYCTVLKIDDSFLNRGLNVGFSGGEKKRLEILQLLLLQPTVVILDEIDSGLDIDSLKIVANALEYARRENPLMSIILITHYQRILEYVTPDYIHILQNGRLVLSGDASLAPLLEAKGYHGLTNSI